MTHYFVGKKHKSYIGKGLFDVNFLKHGLKYISIVLTSAIIKCFYRTLELHEGAVALKAAIEGTQSFSSVS